MPKPVPLEVPKPANAVISTGFGCAAEDCKSSIPRSESGWRLHLKHYGKCSNRDYLVTFGAFFISEVQKPVRRKPPITAEIRCAKVPFWHKTVPKLCHFRLQKRTKRRRIKFPPSLFHSPKYQIFSFWGLSLGAAPGIGAAAPWPAPASFWPCTLPVSAFLTTAHFSDDL